jgi:hypothetical protein
MLPNGFTISRKRREHHPQSDETATRRLSAALSCYPERQTEQIDKQRRPKI